MVAELVFHTNPISRGRIARWMLEEVGQPYRTEIVEYGAAMKDPAFLAINPMGKVPVLTHGGVVVTETAAICTYLADAFPESQLAPKPGDPLRGTYYRWMFFAAGPFESAITNESLGFAVPRERQAMAGYGSITAVTDVLEHAVSQGPFLLGEQFSAADVYLGSQIGFGILFNAIEKRPALIAYSERLNERQAAIRARKIDDALAAAIAASKTDP